MYVSVVIPFYNSNEYINLTLDSIFMNLDLVKEVIIVQDRGSCNPVFDSVYASKVKVILNQSRFRGAGYVRWLGVQHATGDYIAFVDADDIWSADKLPRQLDFMADNDIHFSFMGFKHFRGFYPLGNEDAILPSGPYTIDRFLKKQFVVPCLTVMLSKCAGEFVRFNTLKRRNDYLMWFQLLNDLESHGLRWSGISEVGGYHRLHSNSLTKSRLRSALDQFIFFRKCGLGNIKSSVYMVYYLFNTIGSR
jgi:teichuronic acid biosynthesis glycosyltransferase TuaG